MSTPEQVAARLLALAEKATNGPWAHEIILGGDAHAIKTFHGWEIVERGTDDEHEVEHNFDFIAACREGVPALCAALASQRATIERLEREATGLKELLSLSSAALAFHSDGCDDCRAFADRISAALSTTGATTGEDRG